MSTVAIIKQQIKDLNEQILNIQGHCPHPKEHMYKEHNESVYRRGEIFTKFHCTLCEKSWVKVGAKKL